MLVELDVLVELGGLVEKGVELGVVGLAVSYFSLH